MKDEETLVNEIYIKRGVRQGCILSPVLFNTYADHAMSKLSKHKGVSIGREVVNRLLYADDTVLLAESKYYLQELPDELVNIGHEYDIEINLKKTKSMKLDFPGSDMEPIDLKLGGSLVEEVKLFKYHGVNLSSDLSDLTEVKCRIAIAREKFFERKELFRGDLRLKTKLKILRVFI